MVVTDGLSFINQLKKTKKITYTPKSPALHASFLSHFDPSSYQATLDCTDAQLCADQFYLNTLHALNTFYPTRSITVSDHDPPFVTPEIKSLLRKKNHLMNKGHTTEASSIADKIGKIIARANSTRLSHIDPRQGTKTVWEEVARLQRPKSSPILPKSITPDFLNLHYSSISTDPNYSWQAHNYFDWGVSGRTTSFSHSWYSIPHCWSAISFPHGFFTLVLQSFPNHWPISLTSPYSKPLFPHNGSLQLYI